MTANGNDVVVLTVEDNDVHSYALTKILESNGFKVITAAHGHNAVAIAEMQQPTVVLLDVNLPDMNGFEICRRLKGSQATQHIPVVMYSSYEEFGSMEAHASGAAAYLTYPVHPNDLLNVIRGAVAKRAEAKG